MRLLLMPLMLSRLTLQCKELQPPRYCRAERRFLQQTKKGWLRAPLLRCGRGRALSARRAAPRSRSRWRPLPGAAELPRLAEYLLCRLQENFEALTEKLTLRMEEMGERISDLETRVADLMTEAGVENRDEELGVKTLT
ncbi:heat shock factor-binding protein 1-like protein 1 [Onychostruthus taczanowskii]|uniref:heat shock factor-binding protein 1-like protein 1 n=1 Tax=Onychostruthus taczanowskii TaxID=356909 RepID=UPI001B80939C|nr:heat shock factor-binding protein 1-like protein 1 [Onychostruthus taczanowskii]